MIEVFPFNLPVASALYLLLLQMSWALHFFFVAYVVAGSAYLVLDAFRRADAPPDRIAAVTRDWMPAALGAAITAGVAPLLFVQAAYQVESYTAHLLLWRRMTLIVPALITAFYLFYFQKSSRFGRWNRPTRLVLSLLAFSCLVLIGLAWSRIHGLTMSRSSWTTFGTSAIPDPWIPVHRIRFAVLAAATVLPWSAIVRAQLPAARDTLAQPEESVALRLTRIMLTGWGLTLVTIVTMAIQARAFPDVWRALCSPTVLLYHALLLLAMLSFLMLALRGRTPQSERLRGRLQLLSVLLLAVALSGVREGLRSWFIMPTTLGTRHVELSGKGGWLLFIMVLVVNACVIAWAIRLARGGAAADRGLRSPVLNPEKED